MIMFGSFLPSLGWLAPPKFTRAWEPTLLWNHYTQNARNRDSECKRPDFVSRLEWRWTWRKLLAMRSRCLLFAVMVLPSRLISHRHRPRAELPPAHQPPIDMLR